MSVLEHGAKMPRRSRTRYVDDGPAAARAARDLKVGVNDPVTNARRPSADVALMAEPQPPEYRERDTPTSRVSEGTLRIPCEVCATPSSQIVVYARESPTLSLAGRAAHH
jgi:hypothetical protein